MMRNGNGDWDGDPATVNHYELTWRFWRNCFWTLLLSKRRRVFKLIRYGDQEVV